MFTPDTKLKIKQHIDALPSSLRSQPAPEEELRRFETRFGPIPEDYRWFLEVCGGGIFGSTRIDDIESLETSHAKFQRESGSIRGWKMRNAFVIGWDDSGNPIGIDSDTGHILCEDHNFGGIHEMAPNLESFMLKGIWT